MVEFDPPATWSKISLENALAITAAQPDDLSLIANS